MDVDWRRSSSFLVRRCLRFRSASRTRRAERTSGSMSARRRRFRFLVLCIDSVEVFFGGQSSVSRNDILFFLFIARWKGRMSGKNVWLEGVVTQNCV